MFGQILQNAALPNPIIPWNNKNPICQIILKLASCMVPKDIHNKDKVRGESGSFALQQIGPE